MALHDPTSLTNEHALDISNDKWPCMMLDMMLTVRVRARSRLHGGAILHPFLLITLAWVAHTAPAYTPVACTHPVDT